MNAEETPTVREFKEWMNQSLVHYSNKVVNSGVPAGGIRLGEQQALDIPHLCGRSLLFQHYDNKSRPRPLHLDYISVTPRFKFIRSWLGEDVKGLGDKYTVSENDQKQIVGWYEALAEGAEGATCQSNLKKTLPFRLKQLLIPKDGEYVAVTPLPCLPLGMHLRSGFMEREHLRSELWKTVRKKSTPDAERKTTMNEIRGLGQIACLSNFAVGGANAQNVGGRIFEAYTRPVLCHGLPRMDQDLRKAFSIAYNGVHFRLPKNLIENYQRYLDQEAERSKTSEIKWNYRLKKAESVLLHQLFSSWDRQASAAQNLLDHYQNELPDEMPCFDGDFGKRMTGWLKPSKRDHQWLRTEVTIFIQALQRFVIGKGPSGDPITLGLTKADATRIRAVLEERSLS